MDITNIDVINEQRKSRGFLGISELLELCKQGNIIYDPLSTLISEEAIIGSGNVFYPCVTIQSDNNGRLRVGNNNVFYSQSFLLADKGSIIIGNYNQFGDGGISLKANMPNSQITIEDNGRYVNGIQILGRTTLGSGSQIIGGIITVQNCVLESGETYQHENPDLRAGVLKGYGLARDIVVGRGKVLNGMGAFASDDIQDQSFFHPKKDK